MPQFFQQFSQVISELSLVRKATIGMTLVVAMVVVFYLVQVANEAAYEPLFANINAEDMGSLVSRLEKQGVSYRIDANKKTIMVPSTDVLELRMKLAEEGLPRFGGVGFELFDKSGFGRSNFEQKVVFQRALEGELMRTISNIREVEAARVHLVLPEKSLFAESQQSASASVIIKLGRGGALGRSSVYAITHLVSSAVQGLSPGSVTVVDSEGHLLTTSSGDPAVMAGGQAYDQKSQIERSMEKRIVELLSPVVGLSKVIARVTAQVDFTRTESTDEIVDPTKSAILQETRSTNKKSEAAGGDGAGAGGQNSDEGNEQISYEVSKTTRHQVTPMGTIQKLSVAVLIDGNYETKEDGTVEYKERQAEELTRYETLVKNAIGFSTERGDQLKIDNLKFQAPEEILAASDAWYTQKTTYGFLMKVGGQVIVILVASAVFLFVIRPLMRGLAAPGRQSAGAADPALLPGDVPADMAQLVQADPEAVAQAIKKWLQ